MDEKVRGMLPTLGGLARVIPARTLRHKPRYPCLQCAYPIPPTFNARGPPADTLAAPPHLLTSPLTMAKLDFPTLILLVLSFISWLVAMAGTGERKNGIDFRQIGERRALAGPPQELGTRQLQGRDDVRCRARQAPLPRARRRTGASA